MQKKKKKETTSTLLIQTRTKLLKVQLTIMYLVNARVLVGPA